jgi:hypothetical protein
MQMMGLPESLRPNQVAYKFQRLLQVDPAHIQHQVIKGGTIIIRFAQSVVKIQSSFIFAIDNM